MNIRCRSSQPFRNLSRWQHGVVLPLVAISMVALVAMAGLGIDLGRAYLTKTRVQNALDAAALSGARTLKSFEGNTTQATADALQAFNFYTSQINLGGATPTIQFSNSLSPFVPGGTNPHFVRVLLSNVPVATSLTRALPLVGDNLDVGGTAVAGANFLCDPPPSCETCDQLPFGICVDPAADTNCSDGSCFGYTEGQLVDLRPTDGTTATSGPGNYNLVRLGGSGANVVRENLAGGSACAAAGGTIVTEPGVEAGPVAQGLNTRFNEYGGGLSSATYPPDVVITENISFATYSGRLRGGSFDIAPPTGVPRRRVVSAFFVDCSSPSGGVNTLPVRGIACLFLRSKAVQAGPPNQRRVVAEFITDCDPILNCPVDFCTTGSFFEIMLFKDPNGTVS